MEVKFTGEPPPKTTWLKAGKVLLHVQPLKLRLAISNIYLFVIKHWRNADPCAIWQVMFKFLFNFVLNLFIYLTMCFTKCYASANLHVETCYDSSHFIIRSDQVSSSQVGSGQVMSY